jgi:urease accessory protein UreE
MSGLALHDDRGNAFELDLTTPDSVAMRVRIRVHANDVSEVLLRLKRSQLEGARDGLRRRLHELDA